MNSAKSSRQHKVSISHFVGLSGIGGVQRNFLEYINSQIILESELSHKVYSLGRVDFQYKLPIEVYDIKKIKNLLLLVIDITSKKNIVHFYNNLTSLKMVLLLLFIPARNVILHERGSVWNLPSSRWAVLRFISWKSSLILANSNATKIMLEKKFNISHNKIRVLHNGINVSNRCVKKENSKYSHSTFRIGFIGRLDTPKGVHVLIDAMRYLVHYEIELIIAGDGILENILKEQANDLDNVSFIGRIASPYNFLPTLDLLVVPSIREPLGNVCLEAGLCRVPVLAANVDGIPEIITNKETGELINATDEVLINIPKGAVILPEFVINSDTKDLSTPRQINPKKLANKILELSNSPVLLEKYKEQLHKKVLSYFNVERYASELRDIYFKIYFL